MPKASKDTWIAAGILAALVIAALVAVYVPQSRRLERLRTDTASLRTQLEADMQKVAVVPELIRQVQEMKALYKDFDRRLPKQKELGGFLREISTKLAEEKLTNQIIEPGNPVREELFHTLPIIMRFEGDYLSLASFLNGVGSMQRLMRVEKLNACLNERTHSLDLELQMNIYFTES